MTAVELDTILGNQDFRQLLETAEQSGSIRHSELTEVLEPLELGVLETDAVHRELEQRGIELVEDPREAPPPPPPVVHENGRYVKLTHESWWGRSSRSTPCRGWAKSFYHGSGVGARGTFVNLPDQTKRRPGGRRFVRRVGFAFVHRLR